MNKMMTVEDVDKYMWCATIALKLSNDYNWIFNDAWEYAETLHYDYVECGDKDADAIEVLEEDMTYWDGE